MSKTSGHATSDNDGSAGDDSDNGYVYTPMSAPAIAWELSVGSCTRYVETHDEFGGGQKNEKRN
jgi:hypothetical protein